MVTGRSRKRTIRERGSGRGALRGQGAGRASHGSDRSGADAVVVAIGEQAADLIHLVDRRFDALAEQLDLLAAEASNRLAPREPTAPPGGRPPPVPPTQRPRRRPGEPAAPPDADPWGLANSGAVPSPRRDGGADRELSCTPVASFDTQEGWGRWAPVQAVEMRDGGVVVLGQDHGSPGVSSDRIRLPHGGLFRITIRADFGAGAGQPVLRAQLRHPSGELLAPLTDLAPGETTMLVFLSHRTEYLRVGVQAEAPRAGFVFVLRAVLVEAVDPESHFRRVQAASLGPTLASLASVPSRREMLRDCVESLLVQCDRVRVFLNGYPEVEVPAFLGHPRVEVRRSEDWDDKGDAGKFAWVDADDPPGYRLVVDDDLVFPPDFAATLSAVVRSHQDRAIVGMHGVLLKQPTRHYYDPESRSVFHFQWELAAERTVHVLGTNALCYHSESARMRWQDFMYANMADIFLARYAQANRIPMVTPPRASCWVRQNDQPGGVETIYQHSLRQTGTPLDTSLVQSSLVRWIAPLTLQPTSRPKVVFVLVATSRDDFDAALESWERTCSDDYDWVLVVLAGRDDDPLREHVARTKSKHELHLVDGDGSLGTERLASAIDLAHSLGFVALAVALDCVRFEAADWAERALELTARYRHRLLFALASDTHHGAVEIGQELGPSRTVPALLMLGRDLLGGRQVAVPITRDAVTSLARWADRLARLTSPEDDLRPTAARELGATLRVHEPERLPAIDWHSPDGAIIGAPGAKLVQPAPRVAVPPLTLGELFDRVLVINLERRPDRWQRMRERLEVLGVRGERVRAVDGTWPEVAAEYEEYVAKPLVPQPVGARRVTTSREFFLDYDSQAARAAYAERADGRKAIQSAGAWGYLKTWARILERILVEQIPRTLVLDDDVVFHAKTTGIIAAAAGDLPSDWLVLLLGSLQYHWDEEWIDVHSRFLYHPNGSIVGSHAVGIHFDVAPFLLAEVRRMLLPFDVGALSATTRAYPKRCFVVYPNVAMQDLRDPSDINTSRFQSTSEHGKILDMYRWDLPGQMEGKP